MNLELLSAFPENYTPNDAQDYILEEISKALDDNKKYIIICAPTATGKSFISKTMANYSLEQTPFFIHSAENRDIYSDSFEIDQDDIDFKGCAVLTVTKQLQNQYKEMFADGSVLMGKSNYECSQNELLNCEMGPCRVDRAQHKKCVNNKLCPYYNAMFNAVTNKTAFYNYSMFDCLNPVVKNKEFLICDEASELEGELVNMCSVTIKPKEIKKIFDYYGEAPLVTPSQNAPELEYYNWINDLHSSFDHKYNSFNVYIVNKIKEEKTSKKQTKKRKKASISSFLTKEEYNHYNLLRTYNSSLSEVLDNWNMTRYIISRVDGNIMFQPYNVNIIARNKFFKYGKTVILMSATIVDHRKFAETLGIDDYHYIETETPLASKKAPIRCATKWYLNYNNLDKVIPSVAKMVEAICEKHKGQKGIIHTHSMNILNKLRDHMVHSDRYLFREQGVNNEMLLFTHINSNNDTILVSPSMTHGVDLKGKLGEFQIIVKAPYLPLGDKRVETKFKEDKVWYTDAMLSTLIQMSGRCNRCESDESVTYVLDANIVDAISNNRDKLPKPFLNRFV